MANVKSTCLRFNLDKEQYRRAWEMLQASGKSYTQTVTAALIEYDERHSRLADDPYFENREREDRFVEQIVSAVQQSLDRALPGFNGGVPAEHGAAVQRGNAKHRSCTCFGGKGTAGDRGDRHRLGLSGQLTA